MSKYHWIILTVLVGGICDPIPSFAVEPVTLQLRWHHGFQFAGYYMAKEQGLYGQAGLDVSIKEGSVRIDHVEQVLNRHAQYGVAGSELIIEYMKGKPLQLMAAIFQHSPYALMVRNNSELNNPQQLAGKTVYIGLTPRTAEIQAMLVKEGVPLETLNIIDAVTSLPDYTDPAIDAFSVYETNAPFLLKQQGVQISLIKPVTYGIDFYGDCLFSTVEEIRKHPERSQLFLQASLQGWQYAFEHPEETIALILAKYNTNNRSEAHLRYEYDTMRNLIQPDHIPLGQQNPFRWERIAQTYVLLNMAPDGKNILNFVYDPKREKARQLQTYQRILIVVLAAVSTMVLGLYVWNRTLKARVRRETQTLHDEIHSHRTTQAELEVTLTKYQTLFHAFPLGITVSDDQGNILESNSAAEQLLSVSKSEHEARAIDGQEWKIVRPDGTPMLPEEYASVKALAENRLVENIEMGIVKPDAITWMNVTAAPIPLEQYGVVVTYSDITTRKQAEEALRESERRFRAMSQNSPLGIGIVDSSGNLTGCNQALADIVGYSQEELLQSNFEKFTHPDDLEREWKLIQDMWTRNTDSYRMEKRYVRKDGSIIWVDVAAALMMEDETFKFGFAFVEDITDRKSMEEQLRRSERELSLTLYATTDGIWTWDFMNDSLSFSPRYYTMLGYEPNEFPATFENWEQLIHPDDRKQTFATAEEWLQTKPDEYENEFRLKTKQGEFRWIYARGRVVERDTQGQAVRMIGNHEDITERKFAENRLKSSLAEKETLLRELYHRTKNTLQVIQSMLMIQADRMPENEQVQQLVHDTEQRIMAISLVHHKLYQSQDLSRINMAEYLQELAGFTLQGSGESSRDISLAFEIEELFLLLDTAIPCGLILNELLSNALKHAFPDGRNGKITLALFRNERGTLSFQFADNGRGVAQGFDFRGQEGFGLRTIVAIAEHQMQGTIRFTGKNGVRCDIEFPDTLYTERV